MKIILKIVFVLALSFFSFVDAESQVVVDDTLAVVKIENTLMPKPDRIEYDLVLRKSSNRWRYFANCTFQWWFPDEIVDYSNLQFELLPNTDDLNSGVSTGEKPFKFMTGVLSDRFQLIVLGPEIHDESMLIGINETKKIGRYRVSTKDGSPIPKRIAWKQPILYYQTAAFKYFKDNSYQDSLPYNIYDIEVGDNVEMSNLDTNFVSFEDDKTIPPATVLDYFRVGYKGNLLDTIEFQTLSEYLVRGFIIKRTKLLSLEGNLEDIPDDAFTEEVASYLSPPWNTIMTGNYTSRDTNYYGVVNDEIQTRGVNYIYRLYYQDDNGEVFPLATASTKAPNSVIYFAEAVPNPFETQTTINYKVEDDVILDCYVFDRIGQIVETGFKNKTTLKNNNGTPENSFVFSASKLTAQGTYDVVFIARPLNDASVELSRAVVKINYVVGYSPKEN